MTDVSSNDQRYSTDPDDYVTCPRVVLTIDYYPESISETPTSPKDLYKAILSLGVSMSVTTMQGAMCHYYAHYRAIVAT